MKARRYYELGDVYQRHMAIPKKGIPPLPERIGCRGDDFRQADTTEEQVTAIFRGTYFERDIKRMS